MNFFKVKKFPEAVQSYSEAINRDPENHVNYSNRAAAYIKLGAIPEALKDAEKCISIKPDFAKGYLRKGQAQFFMKDYKKCLETYQLGLEYDPNNQEIAQGISKAVEQINKGMDEESVRKNVERDPEIQNILRDPMMKQVLDDLKNGRGADEYMKDKKISENIMKLFNAGILSTGQK